MKHFPIWRALVLSVVAVQIVAGLALAAAGIAGWGAGTEAGFPVWAPTFTGLLVGSFISVSAALTFHCIRRRTARPLHIHGPQLALGLIAAVFLIMFAFLASGPLGDPEAYRDQKQRMSTLESLHLTEVNPFTRDDAIPARLVIITTLMVCFPGPISWLAYGSYWFLRDGLEPVSREVRGRDPIGQIMSSQGI